MATYTVNPRTQVHHEGVTYGEGQTLTADPDTAAPWLAAGIVTQTAAPTKATAKRAKAAKTSTRRPAS